MLLLLDEECEYFVAPHLTQLLVAADLITCRLKGRIHDLTRELIVVQLWEDLLLERMDDLLQGMDLVGEMLHALLIVL